MQLKHTRYVSCAIFSLAGLTVFVGLILSNIVFTTHAYETPVTIEVPTSCSLTTGGGNYAISPLNGTTTTVNGNNVTVSCNDASGYAIYAIGFSGDLYDGNYHTDLIASLGNSYNIKTDGSGTYSSNWKMKITPVSNVTAANSYGSFQNIPASYTKVAEYNSSTTAGVFTPAYQVYISGSQPAGTYTGQVKYTLVHPSTAAAPVPPLEASDCPAGYVCYAPNSSDIEGSMATISNNTIASSPKAGRINIGQSASVVRLIAPNYKRSGYGFAGWSTDYEATNASTIYGPIETITVNLSSSGLILYPVWVANAGNLQGWNGCSSLTTAPTNARATLSSVTALTDTRDGNTYAVARLADGKCWMIENLRLDDSATLTVTNTHNPLHDTNNNNIVTLKTDYTNNTIANHLIATSNSWCTDSNAACIDQTRLNTNNTRISDSSLIASRDAEDATSKWYSYGNYYNWYSATAGNGTYSFNTKNNSVTGDLCPAGWHLPKGGDKNNTANSEFWALGLVLIGTEPANTSSEIMPSYTGSPEGENASKVFRTYPNNFIYSGFWNDAQSEDRNAYGGYWSSTAAGDDYTYRLYLHNNAVGPGTLARRKFNGLSVRCVAGS